MRKGEQTRKRILAYIVSYIDEHEWSPSYREIRDASGLRSLSTVHNHMHALYYEGMVEFGGGARTLKVTEKGRAYAEEA